MNPAQRCLCAWCGRNMKYRVLYNGEYICGSCLAKSEKELKRMEDWQKSLDRYLTTPPEEEIPESNVHCHYCHEELIPDDDYFELDDNICCENCAKEWLEGHRNWVTEEMAYGERR